MNPRMASDLQALDQTYHDALKTLTGSDHAWINAVFRWCVVQLIDLAAVLGISYEALNVIVFVFVLPTMLTLSLALNGYWLLQRRQLTANTKTAKVTAGL